MSKNSIIPSLRDYLIKFNFVPIFNGTLMVSNLYSEAVKSSDELSQSTKQLLFVTFIIGEHSYKYWAGKELKD